MLGLALLAGCGQGQPALTAAEIAAKSAQAMSEAKTLHFAITMSGRLTYLDTSGTLGLKTAEGDVVAPDKVRAKVKTTTFGVISEIGLVGIGAQQWATNPLNNRWSVLPPQLGSFNLATMFDAKQGVPGLLATQQWTADPAVKNGLGLKTTADGAQLAAMTSGMITKGKVDVAVTIDPTTYRITRATLVERDSSPQDPTTWQIVLSSPSGAIEIVPPPVQ